MEYTNDKYIMAFGKNLAKQRVQQGLSLAELTDKIWEECGVMLDRNSIYRIEKGRVNCTILTLHLIAKGLKKHPAELLSFDKTSK
jgi:hypothetical protein